MTEDVTAAPNPESKPMTKKATKKTSRKRAKAKSSPSQAKAARKNSPRKAARKRGPGKRYTAAEKARILAAAKKEGLTGAKAAKRFGISMLTFYRWRGPVRGRKRGRPLGSKNRVAGARVKVDLAKVRREVQAQVRRLLPQIIREEVAKALGGGGLS
jgi:transposase-like protein